VFAAFCTQREMRMHHVIPGLSGCTIFFHIISQTAQFSEEKKIERKMCNFDFLYKMLSEIFLVLRRTDRDVVVYVY
jgi:hypothetical protein